MSGWIKLHRQLIDWEWYTDHNTCRLFIHCLFRANHQSKSWRGKTINRGEFISSYEKLGLEIGLSRQQIRTSISKLSSTNEITTQGSAQHTVFIVNNYNEYQEDNQQNNQQITNEQPTSNQRITTNKNVKNEKNTKTLDQSAIDQECLDYCFDQFWNSGIRKANKKKAQPLFAKVLKNNSDNAHRTPYDFSTMLAADIEFRLSSNQQGFSEMHPTTYLNGERWNDEKVNPNEISNRVNGKSTGTNRKSLLQRSEDEVRRSLALIEREEIRDGLVPSDESVISTQMGIGERADS